MCFSSVFLHPEAGTDSWCLAFFFLATLNPDFINNTEYQVRKADVANKAVSNCVKAYNGPRFEVLDSKLNELKNLICLTKTEATNVNIRAGTLVTS